MSAPLFYSGPPAIEGAVYGDQLAVVCRAERVADLFAGTGATLLLEERYRLTGEIAWDGVAEGPLLGLVSDVARPTWRLAVRTAASGETGDPLEVVVRTTSPLVLTAPLGRRSARTGRPLASVRVAFRSLALYTALEIGLSESVPLP